jgi:hypothetical protein
MYDVKAKGLVQSICVNYISMVVPKNIGTIMAHTNHYEFGNFECGIELRFLKS